jgi:hypothetical protein
MYLSLPIPSHLNFRLIKNSPIVFKSSVEKRFILFGDQVEDRLKRSKNPQPREVVDLHGGSEGSIQFLD